MTGVLVPNNFYADGFFQSKEYTEARRAGMNDKQIEQALIERIEHGEKQVFSPMVNRSTWEKALSGWRRDLNELRSK